MKYIIRDERHHPEYYPFPPAFLALSLFRQSSGLWMIRSSTRVYFGASSDQSVPADYNGGGSNEIGIFRPSSGLWAVSGITRAYFGSSGDIPVTR